MYLRCTRFLGSTLLVIAITLQVYVGPSYLVYEVLILCNSGYIDSYPFLEATYSFYGINASESNSSFPTLRASSSSHSLLPFPPKQQPAISIPPLLLNLSQEWSASSRSSQISCVERSTALCSQRSRSSAPV